MAGRSMVPGCELADADLERVAAGKTGGEVAIALTVAHVVVRLSSVFAARHIDQHGNPA